MPPRSLPECWNHVCHRVALIGAGGFWDCNKAPSFGTLQVINPRHRPVGTGPKGCDCGLRRSLTPVITSNPERPRTTPFSYDFLLCTSIRGIFWLDVSFDHFSRTIFLLLNLTRHPELGLLPRAVKRPPWPQPRANQRPRSRHFSISSDHRLASLSKAICVSTHHPVALPFFSHSLLRTWRYFRGMRQAME